MGDLRDWAGEWDLILRSNGAPKPTLSTYRQHLDLFQRHLEQVADVQTVADLTKEHVIEYMRVLVEDEAKSKNTRRLRLIVIRGWWRYVMEQPDSGVTVNITAGVKLPEQYVPPVPIISDEDLALLLAGMAGNSFLDRRDTVVLRLLLDCGWRVGELIGIDVDDIEQRHQDIRVIGKGSKIRTVPYGTRTALALRKYLRVRAGHVLAASPALLLPARQHGTARMSRAGVQNMLHRRGLALLGRHVHPHQLRHTWAADYKRAGGQDSSLERLAGWSSSTMTRRYGNAVADEIAQESARRMARGDRV